MASIVGQFVVVQTDTGDGLVVAQVIVTFGALDKRDTHRRNAGKVNVNDGQMERDVPVVIAAAAISGNIDTDFGVIIESPFLISVRFIADDAGQGAELFIVDGYAADSCIRLNFIAGDKSSQGSADPW